MEKIKLSRGKLIKQKKKNYNVLIKRNKTLISEKPLTYIHKRILD